MTDIAYYFGKNQVEVVRKNMDVELCLEEMEPENKQYLPQFVGIQQVEVSV